MKNVESKDIRNVGLIGHKASGKTSLAEAALWTAKITARLGKTADGTSVLDFEDEEQKRVMSTTTSIASIPWKKRKINLLDTPGDANFLKDTRFSMQAMDSALIVVSAKDGVEPMTERVYTWANELKLAKAFVISKMDTENADFQKQLQDIKEHLCPQAAAIQIPIGKEANFRGVVDLVAKKAYLFQDGDKGDFTTAEIPADVQEQAEEARGKLVEDIAAADEKLMEKFFEGSLTEEEINQGLAKAIENGTIVPVYCASGTQNKGLAQILDFVVDVLPDPTKHAPFKGKLNNEDASRKASADEPLSCLIFKTIVDQHSGRISVCRVLSGNATSDTALKNGNRNTQERFGTLQSLVGKKLEPLGEAPVGDIFAVVKLKESKTGDTLSIDGFVADVVELPPPLVSRAIAAAEKGAEDKIAAALARITDEDPGLIVHRHEETGQLLLSGSGQQHIEVAVEKMKRKFGAACELTLPRIPYRETFTAAAKNIEGKHKKQSGGHGQFGVAFMDFEPGERGTGFVFEDAIVGGAIPRQWIPSVEKGLLKSMSRGIIAGYPVVDIKVRVFDGKYHPVDSSDMAFQIAGSKGLKAAIAKARPALLEPIMNMEVVVPEENMGDVMGDVNSRRGRVLGSESSGKYCTVKAQIPAAEIQTYEATLRAMTQGRGSFTMTQSHYELVPPPIQEKIIKESGFKAVDDEE